MKITVNSVGPQGIGSLARGAWKVWRKQGIALNMVFGLPEPGMKVLRGFCFVTFLDLRWEISVK